MNTSEESRTLLFTVTGDIDHSFVEALRESKVDFSRHMKLAESPELLSYAMHVYSALKDASPWVGIAAVLVTWIRARSHRKVIVTSKTGVTVSLDGYSVKDVESLLKQAHSVEVTCEVGKGDA